MNKAKSERTDLGLAVSRLFLQPGEVRTQEEIAARCDCTKQYISLVEIRALKKFRKGCVERGIDASCLVNFDPERPRLNEAFFQGYDGSHRKTSNKTE